MRSVFTFCFICISFLSALGQSAQEYILRGKVVDEKKEGIPFTNAALYRLDSTLVTGAVSNAEGIFIIKSEPGSYYLKLTFISYDEKIVSPIIVEASDINLGSIQLTSSSRVLEELVIEGERSQMELSLDKRVFHVGKDLSNISGSVSDILQNVPSVAVDMDGNVSLRGSDNVRILIDGKPSGLTGISTANALRQLQANLIESVEIITNPSARYDAEGEVGIINIILKKETRNGVNGSFALSAGAPANYGASYSINFRKEKYNFFSSYGINYQDRPGSGKSYQRFERADSTFAYRQDNSRSRKSLSHNLRLGMDYFFNDKNTLTGSFVIRKSSGNNTSNYLYRDYDSNDSLIKTINRLENEKEPGTNAEMGLSYRKTFDRKNQLLTADFKWIQNDETEMADFTETNESDGTIKNQRSTNTEDELNVLAQVDYVQPYGTKGKWEAGARTTLRVLDNAFKVEEQDDNEKWFLLDDFNNNLIYSENIYAAYAMTGNEWGNFSYQAGIRGELSDISVELKKTNEITYQNYFNAFPSLHLSYRLSPEKTLQLSYSSRLSRPRFRDLIPFSGFSDNRSIRGGNPNLRPEYTKSFEAGYLLNWNSGSLLSSAYYRHRTGVIQQVPIEDEKTGYVRPFPINLAIENAFGLEFNFSWNPVEWWRFNSSSNFYRAIREGNYNNTDLFSDTYTWNTRTISRFTIFKDYIFQSGINYRAPRQTPVGTNKAMYSIDLGLSHDVFSKKGTLTLSVRDLLNSRKYRGTTVSEGYYAESEFQWRSRQTTLTFTYRLNQKKDRQGGGDDDSFNGDNDFGG